MKGISNYLPWIIITVGIILRLSLFLANRSLYIDEADLINNITQRSFIGLTKPLDEEQHAPIGFLWFAKAALITFGDSEYTFRLYALLMGITSLVLFYLVAQRLLSRRGMLVALTLFSFSGGLIYYSSEAKQYMGDVTFTLLLLYLFSRSKHVNQAFAVLIGALVPWFSHPSIFILFSIALVKWKKLLFALPIWMGSILLEYFLLLRFSIARPDEGQYWSTTFAPFPPHSLSDMYWVWDAFLRLLSFVWISPQKIFFITSIALLLAGLIRFMRNKRTTAWILLLPFIVSYIASGLHTYPFVERLLLFLSPMLFIFAGEGSDGVLQSAQALGRVVYRTVIVLLFIVALYNPIVQAYGNLRNPPVTEDIKPLLGFYVLNRQEGDVLYVSSGAQSAFRYYAPKYDIRGDRIIYGSFIRGHATLVTDEIMKLKGRPRVWILFSHINSPSAQDVNNVRANLQSMGIVQTERLAHGAALYLYDLR